MTKTKVKPAAKKDSTSKPLTPIQELMLCPKTTGTLPAPADLSFEQLTAFEEMNDPLRQKTLAIRELLNGEVDQLMESEYQLGTLVKEIHDDPGTYGATSDDKLAKFFGDYGKTKYANARRIRERYEPERFKELMNARGPDGHRLEYTHLALLLLVDDDQADKLIDDILAAEWSVNELRNYLARKAQKNGRKPRTGPPRPADFFGLVENITAFTEHVHKQYQDVWDEGEALLDAFTALPAEKLDEACRKKVQEAAAVTKETAGGLKGIAVELASIEKRIEETINQRRSGGKLLTIPGGDEPQVYCEPSYPDDDELEEDDE